MKNKIKLKKTLKIACGMIILFLLLIGIFNYLYLTKLEQTYNAKVSAIVGEVTKKYPDVSKPTIMDILNNSDIDLTILKEYGLTAQDNWILRHAQEEKGILWGNIILSLTLGGLLILIFLKYNCQKDHEIGEITKYIAEINKKNYKLALDDLSEDELSILKNEIYKTTIMLKEIATLNEKAKKELKVALEDISHQLKTPLTSILIMLDNLIDNPQMDSKTKATFLHDIKREVINLNFLVQNILKLSRFDANTIKFKKEEFNVSDLIHEIKQNVAPICDLKNITLETDIAPNIKLKGDFHWQVEALTNIVKNCIEHSPENKKIRLKARENKAYGELIITDQGPGIPPDDLPNIFKRFYKGQNASSDSVGIGLALAKTIIEKDNGTIKVESNETGTTFIIKYFKIW